METIAEGVERVDQQSFLVSNGCHLAQGFLFSRALPSDELAAWVRARL